MKIPPAYTAFRATRRIGFGTLTEAALKAKRSMERHPQSPVLIFHDSTGEVVDVDLRGTQAEVAKRLAEPGEVPAAADPGMRGPGRPKLGVVAREVTLLPRHWEWLATQPGGASVALRKLVESGMRANASGDRVRRAREAAYRFMSAMAGNEPGFEEAIRALFAGTQAQFEAMMAPWPRDIRHYASKLAVNAFSERDAAGEMYWSFEASRILS